MTLDKIAMLKELERKATPAPWTSSSGSHHHVIDTGANRIEATPFLRSNPVYESQHAEMRLLLELRNNASELISAAELLQRIQASHRDEYGTDLEALRAENERLKTECGDFDKENDALLHESEVLHATIARLESTNAKLRSLLEKVPSWGLDDTPHFRSTLAEIREELR